MTLNGRPALVSRKLVALYAGAAIASVALVAAVAAVPAAPVWLPLLLAWGSLSLCLLAVLYALARTGVDTARVLRLGAAAPVLRVVLLPYRLVQYAWIALRRAAATEPALQAVTPSLLLGGRALPWDRRAVRALGVTAAVDLCSELPEAPVVRALVGERYLATPALDGGTAPDAVFDAAVETAVAWVRSGARVLVHCALGHGRSASVAAAALVALGETADVDAALGLLTRLRPKVRLHAVQRASLDRWALRRSARAV